MRKHHQDMDEKINQWLAFIDDEDKELVDTAVKKNKVLEKAQDEVEYLTGDAELRRLAELQEKWAWDEQFYRSMAIKEGRKEEKKEIAKKLLKLGLEINKIIEATGLTKEEIENLKN